MNTKKYTYTMTDLRQQTNNIVNVAREHGAAYVYRHSQPVAVVVSPDYLEQIEQALEEDWATSVYDVAIDQPTITLDKHLKIRAKHQKNLNKKYESQLDPISTQKFAEALR